MRYGLILLPTAQTAAELEEYSGILTAAADPLMRLGSHAPPHVTLLHFTAHGPIHARLVEAVATLGADARVIPTGLLFRPVPVGDYYVPEGGIHAGLQVAATEPLRALHHRMLTLVTDLGGTVISPSGADYNPHLTLAVLRTASPLTVRLPPQLFLDGFSARPALGVLGPYGTFPQLLGGNPPV
ncbi:2'-5' RNA ligase family protein [Streptomyces sp. AN091965]|uniref:2'-5' RNA ligase family protein n=1 Tax=Streptomyces sp. AN091965 TaxID=2927803 RepID=UPI001F61A273|nr:2'-5' RNA ligase family protein [Streptomyces sp. AN091965]MCI3928865.1 2'-5' RNA ligase family protein [Streptomyces sp. AN091965]